MVSGDDEVRLKKGKGEVYFGIGCEMLHLQRKSFPTSSIKKSPTSLLSRYQPHTLTGSLLRSNCRDLFSVPSLPYVVPTPSHCKQDKGRPLCPCVHRCACLYTQAHTCMNGHTNRLPNGGTNTSLLVWGNSTCVSKEAEATGPHMYSLETLHSGQMAASPCPEPRSSSWTPHSESRSKNRWPKQIQVR